MKKAVKNTILGIAGAATAVNVVRAAKFKPEKKEREALPEEKVDAKRAAENLSKAITFQTISHVDKSETDFSAFDAFHDFLDEAYPLIKKNLSKEIVKEAGLIYLWKGKRSDLEPVALLAHQDVVPISPGTENDWNHEPFSGDNDGVYIWGRGALDMKNHLMGVMEAVETLLEEGFEPERDVYLLFGQDEEVVANPDNCARAIMKVLQSRGIRLESLMDEGGAVLPVNVKGIIKNKNLAGVGIAEKGYCDYEITVTAKGGHTSSAPQYNALGDLADVINDLEKHQFKSELLPFVTDMFMDMGKNCSLPARLITCNIPVLKPAIKGIMKKIPATASFIRTVTAVTMASGSPAANILPQRASIVVNFRPMPGVTAKDVEEHIRKVVRNKNIEIRALKAREASRISSTDSRCYNIIKELIEREDSSNIVAPYLVMGGTDACNYEPICDNIYRYAPYRVSPALLLTTHGTNERIPISAIEPAIAFFKRYIRRVSQEI